ncbi:MAG: biosynthetic peptidoglycan transglycosylase, partial [Christensenella sp.]
SLFKPREKKPNFALGVVLSTIKMSFVAIIVVVAIALGSLMGVANAYLGTTPELDISKIETQSENTKILTQDGTQLATYTGLENREWANLEEIPKDLQNAVIAVEDIRFRYHNGVDLRRLIGAFVSNLSENQAQGGSTITQQLVKNELLTNERSYKRKLQEAYLAIELEKTYSKDQILEAYLNAIPLGGTVYGVKAAAKDYFGKGLSELTLKEMICIASITQNPTKYSPRRATYVKTDNLPGLINRMNIFAERMYWNGDITREQYEEVLTPAEVYLAPECLEQGTDNVWKLKKDAKMVLKDGYLDIWKAEMNILEQSPVNSLYPYPHFIE